MDAATGSLVYYKNPDEEIPPASLTKLVTMHLLLEAVSSGEVSLDDLMEPPRESWAVNQPPRSSLMGLAAGQTVSLRELMLGLAIPSGNDAAAAAALRIAPRVEDFVERMNRAVEVLGLRRTRFVEPSGVSEYNSTTAREFALFCYFYLARHPGSLRDFHGVRRFSYPLAENVPAPYRLNPMTNHYTNHNNLLGQVPGVDGLKTGYIDEAGFNIALTAEREGTRFILVILGAPAGRGGDLIRDNDGRALLEWAFASFKTLRPRIGELPSLRVWKGKTNYIGLVPGEPLPFTVRAGRAEELFWRVEPAEGRSAPLPAGSFGGRLILSDKAGELRSVPLITADAVEPGGFFKRLMDSIRLFFRGLGGKRLSGPGAAGFSAQRAGRGHINRTYNG
jgi:D-alanyl-D-alanine carboxypeptidase (penicillin-binding protein 5/6)